jgi:hypothetical protein
MELLNMVMVGFQTSEVDAKIAPFNRGPLNF